MHGYELRERLSSGLGDLWRIASSQLYSVLHRLEEKGWIRCSVEPQAGRPDRKVFRITPSGDRAFWSWATTAVGHLRDVRVELLAKVYFLRQLDPNRIGQLIDVELETLTGLRERLRSRERIASDDKDFGALALAFRVSQLSSTVAWLESNRERLTSVEGEK